MSELSPQPLSLESLITELLIESEKHFDSFLKSTDSLTSAWASEMSELNSSGFLTVGFAQLGNIPSLNVALFFPLSFSVAAEIRIQLLSEAPLTEFRVLDMDLSPCPLSLSINPSDGRGPGGEISKLQKNKTQFTVQGLLPLGSHIGTCGRGG